MQNKENNYKMYICAFIIPVITLVLAYAIIGTYPFGDWSVLSSDMTGQYIDLTVNFFEQLKAGDGIFLTWRSGLGSNLYAWATYILMSPLNILFLIFDVKYYQEVYLAIILIKFGFIGLFTSIYLNKSRLCNISGKMNVLFVLFYALCAFNIKATINVMWLDNVALLPIALLGIENIICKKKYLLFTFVIAMCFITNYYISYITGVFCFMYFCYFAFINHTERKEIFKAFALFMFSTVLALMMSAVVVLPAWEAISNTYTTVFEYSEQGALVNNDSVSTILASLSAWSIKDTLKAFFIVSNMSAVERVVHGFFGILPIILTILYFFNPKFGKKEKVLTGAIIATFIFGLLLHPLYVAWHLFRMPTCFEGRFFYATALFFVIVSVRSFKHISSIQKKHLIFPVLLCIFGVNYAMLGDVESWVFINSCVISIVAVLYFLILGQLITSPDDKKTKKMLMILSVSEMVIATVVGITVIKTNDYYSPRNELIKFVEEYSKIFDEAPKDDDTFCRMDSTILRGYNSSMSTGYNGVVHFSSLANQKTFNILRNIGMVVETDNKVMTNFDNSIALDSLLNIKYISAISKKNKIEDNVGRTIYIDSGFRLTSDVYKKVDENENSVLFENSLCFPLMFAASDSVIDVDKKLYDKRETLNSGYRSLEIFLNSLRDTDYVLYTSDKFNSKKVKNAAVTPDEDGQWNDLTLSNLEEGEKKATTLDKIGNVVYKYKVENPGNYFTSMTVKADDKEKMYNICKIGINGIPTRTLSMEGECICLGYYEKGDEIEFQISASKNIRYAEPVVMWFDQDKFEKISKDVNSVGLLDIEQKGTDITATSNFENEELVFSSIAYDEGFSVYIDGVETEKVCIAGGFLGYQVPAGKHKVLIQYISPGFVAGRNISVVGCVLFGLFFIIRKKLK